MTTHKAEGLTVKEAWTRPDGTNHLGTVLVQAAGAEQPSLYVALSRHVGEVRMFAGLDQVEDAQGAYQRGPADSDSQRIARGVEAIAEHMRATEKNENDRPVHEDLVDVDAAAAATLARVRARTPQQMTQQDEATMAPTPRTGEVLAKELRAGDVLLDHDGNDEVFVRRTRTDAAHQDVEIEYLVPGQGEPVRVPVPAADVVLVADHLRVDQRAATEREQEWIAQRRPPVDVPPVVPDTRSALERIRDRVAAREPAQEAAHKLERTTAEKERAARLRRDEDARRPQNTRGPSIR